MKVDQHRQELLRSSAAAGADHEVVGREATEGAEHAREMPRLHDQRFDRATQDLSHPAVTRKGDSADTAWRKNTAEALEAGGS